MVKIRLRRTGGKKQASYRVVVADSRSPRDGRFIESIGFFNPRTEPETVSIHEDRALHWLSVGAQPSEAVARLLKNSGTLARFERLRQGESLEALISEAEEATKSAAPISPKTRREATGATTKKSATKPKATKSEPAAEAETEPEAKAETEVQPEAEAQEAEEETPAEANAADEEE